jgi:hypothetical protein
MQGVTLLTLGAEEMVGQQAVGFKEPVEEVVEDPSEASKRLVTQRVREKQQGTASASRAPESTPAFKQARLSCCLLLTLFAVAVIHRM